MFLTRKVTTKILDMYQKPDYEGPLYTGQTYHVFNRTNNGEMLFKDDSERRFFLKQYAEYVSPFVDTFAYCLMGNHFHILIRVKEPEAFCQLLRATKPRDLTIAQKKYLSLPEETRSAHEVLSTQFMRFFTSYSMHVNTKWKRKGNLFHRPFKRVLVEGETHFGRLIFYIHSNPRKHGVSDDFKQYTWSSYQTILSDAPTKLLKDEVLDWFGGKEAFENFHSQEHDLAIIEIEDILIEV